MTTHQQTQAICLNSEFWKMTQRQVRTCLLTVVLSLSFGKWKGQVEIGSFQIKKKTNHIFIMMHFI